MRLGQAPLDAGGIGAERPDPQGGVGAGEAGGAVGQGCHPEPRAHLLLEGEQVEAVILGIDSEQQRISLGMKQLAVDPWSDIDAFFKIGDVVQGTISKITSFGAFVELKAGANN